MNYRMISRIISRIMFLEAGFMIPSIIICLIDNDFIGLISFAVSTLLIALFSSILMLIGKGCKKQFFAREGFVSVGISWILMSALGCLPFFISGSIPNYLDALFEMVSGFTTTGASILNDVESLSRGMLYWRSFSHWLGGMGVLVFLLALPTDKESAGFSLQLLKAESPGPSVGKLVPKMHKTAQILYIIYIALTALDLLFLIIGRMDPFEALCTALGTAGTGGFGVRNDSLASYSPYIQNVTTIFMILFGINFSCYYLILLGKIKATLKDEELRTYFVIILLSVGAIAINVRGMFSSIHETLRHSFFQVASIITTTGFATVNFDEWPNFSRTVLLLLMISGACAGSTAGGLKISRMILLFKTLKRNMKQMLFPKKVQVIRNNDMVVSEEIIKNTSTYLVAYTLIIVVSFLIISIDGYSILTNASAVISCFNNIGPGFELVGPSLNYSLYSGLSKVILIIDMLAGRLEIFPMLVLVSRSTWKKK